MDNKKTIIIVIIFGIIFAITGGTFAYLSWQTSEEQKTNVTFTVAQNFSCAADGGGNITSADVSLAPATCTNSTYAIKRTVTVKPTINASNTDITMSLWLNINALGTGLSNSQNFKYALTTSDTSCETGVVSTGTFNGKVAGDKVSILEKSYSTTTTDTYYLYIWLDKEETSTETMNQTFELSLGGDCTNAIKPEKPVLDENGMIPVVISDTGVTTTISSTDSNWYNYDEQKWANIVLTKSSSRSKYLGTSGVTVTQSDVLAYYVWIPRYKYRIPEVSCSTLTNPTVDIYPSCYTYILSDSDRELLIDYNYTIVLYEISDYTLEEATIDVNRALQTGIWSGRGESGTEEVWGTAKDLIEWYNEDNPDNQITYTTEFSPSNSMRERPIDIVFESKTTDKSFGDAVNTYYTHPAFTFGTTELSGIWVGKFETTWDATTPTVLPDTPSLRNQNVSTQFETSLKFSGGTLTDGVVSFKGNYKYGLTANTNSHMMKNSEWGAVAYLSHSIYGANREIYINNSKSYYTGRSGGNVGGSTAINTVYTEQTSTTQYNDYGFYTWDGYLLDYGTNTKGTTHDITKVASTTGNITGIYDMSGGAYEYVMGNYANTMGSSENYIMPPSQYYDLYSSTSLTTACNGGICYGHALSETARWYGDYAYFVSSDYPWFSRGSGFNGVASVGSFNLSGRFGSAESISSWRSVLSLEESVAYDPGFQPEDE